MGGNSGCGSRTEKKSGGYLKGEKKAIVALDFYPGVFTEEMRKLAKKLSPVKIIDTEDCAKEERKLEMEFQDYLTDDRVFGILCHKNLSDFFEQEKFAAVVSEIEAVQEGLIVIMGLGTDFIGTSDIHVYCNLTRWEIQLRYREGMPNWHCSNYDAPVLAKYKRGFFIEWRLADRYKRARYEQFDYILENEKAGKARPRIDSGRNRTLFGKKHNGAGNQRNSLHLYI